MAATHIAETVESLAEAIVFLEHDDLNGLADIHSQLEKVAAWTQAESRPRSSLATTALMEIVEQIILQEHAEPAAGLATIAKTISALQRAVESPEERQVDFPEELGLPRPAADGNTEALPPANGNGAAAYSFTVQLPSYVDDAIFSEFLTRQVSVLEEVETAILDMEQGAGDTSLGDLNRHLHTLKGETALLGLSDIEHLCHVAEDLVARESPSAIADRLLALKDWLKQAFDAYAGEGDGPASPGEMERILLGATQPAAAQNAQDPGPPEPAAATPGAIAAAPLGSPFKPGPLTGDRELLADFITEAGEHLDTSDIQLLTLETDPRNLDAINAVFRAFHTIKGVCGFIDLDEMQALAHEAENLLDLARKDVLLLEGPNLDIVFDAIDMLKKLLANVREALEKNADLSIEPGLPTLLDRIKRLARGEMLPADPPAACPDVELADPTALGAILVSMGSATSAAIEEALDLQAGAAIGHRKLGEVLQQGALASSAQIESALAVQRDRAQGDKLGEILVDMGAVDSADVRQSLGKQESEARSPRLGELLVRTGEVSARDVSQALRVQKRHQDVAGRGGGDTPEGGAVTIRDTVKVDAHRLDQLVDMIGELVIAESMVCQSRELVTNLSADLSRHVSQLDKITRELQEMAMGLRMVPVRSTFQKMARLVRDLARKTGKEVNFTMQGEDTELDKTVVDRISDPLVHMVRNSVDHGLEENSEARRAAGKSPAGTITLRAYHCGGNIQIEIADDGRGLDREAILAKARERGLIEDDGGHLPDKDVWPLIFEAGFSTAKQLTEVSGRGVGMDVVRRNIAALRGEIDIHSETGVGSRFIIKLPLTLAIIDGMVVRVGRERYIIPTLSIVVSVRPRAEELYTVTGAAQTMKLQGEIIPLFRLGDLFHLSGGVTSPTEGTVVVLENGGRRVGLLIDEILGQQQIVIKSLGESLRGTQGIAGGAIMPDGKVGLILDIAGVLRLATDRAAV